MAVYGTDFLFNGRSSSEFGVVLNSKEVIESYEMGLERSIISGDINRYRTQVNHMGTKYNSVLSFEFSIIKDPCTYHNDDLFFTRQEIRRINAWLTSPQFPTLLYFPDDEEDIYYYGIITSVDSNVVNTKVYMLTFQVTCNAPWGFSSAKIIESAYDEEEENINRTIVLTNDSDDTQLYVYPTITIVPHVTGIVTITNNSDNLENKTLSINVLEEDAVYINCRLCTFKTLSGVLSLEDLGIQDVGNIYIPRLIYGDNNISLSGNADFTFTWREPRKVGVA